MDTNMEYMDRLRDSITDYIYEEGREYNRLLISRTFYTALKKEAKEHDTKIDLPRMEIKDNVDYDFKLLPWRWSHSVENNRVLSFPSCHRSNTDREKNDTSKNAKFFAPLRMNKSQFSVSHTY